MPQLFPIVQVSQDAPEEFEAMGTKEKFWFCDRTRLKTLDAFLEAQKFSPKAARIWLERLAMVSATNTIDIFNCLPAERISPLAIEFAQKILEVNQQRLLESKL